MNTKGIKFLAVLAVLAMAFAVFATIAPAEQDDAATALPTPADGVVTLTEDVTLEDRLDVEDYRTIDLAGYTLTVISEDGVGIRVDNDTGSVTMQAFEIKNGTLVITVTGEGTDTYENQAIGIWSDETLILTDLTESYISVNAANDSSVKSIGIEGEYGITIDDSELVVVATDRAIFENQNAAGTGIVVKGDSTVYATAEQFALRSTNSGVSVQDTAAVFAMLDDVSSGYEMTGTFAIKAESGTADVAEDAMLAVNSSVYFSTAPTTLTLVGDKNILADYKNNETALTGGRGILGGTWAYSTSTLTLADYIGTGFFKGTISTLEFTGTNIITTENASTTDLYTAGIYSTGDTVIKATEADSSLTVHASEKTAAAIIVDAGTLTVGDATANADETTLSVVGAMKGLWMKSPDTKSLTISNAVVYAYGSEKAITATNGTGNLVIDAGSHVFADLTGTKITNNIGDDDFYGVKVYGNLSVTGDSYLYTKGLRVDGTMTTTDGYVYVSGGYTNETGYVAGINLMKTAANSVDNTITLTRADEIGEAYGTYISDDADYYTAGFYTITVIEKNGKKSYEATATDNETISNVIAAAPSNSEEITVIIPSGTENIGDLALSVPKDCSLGIKIMGTTTLTGTIAVKGASETNTFTLTNFTGTAAFYYGSLGMYIIEWDGGDIELANGDILKITGDTPVIAGNVSITGPADGTATVICDENQTLTIAPGATLTLTGKVNMNNDGAIIGNGTIFVDEDAQFYSSKAVSVNFDGTGTIIVDEAIETIKLSGNYNSQNSYTATQKVVVDGNLTIGPNAYIIINGGLEVLDGVTVTIQDGGYLLVQSVTAYSNIYGTIKSSAVNGFQIAASVDGDVNIYGSIIAAKATNDNEITVSILGAATLTGTMTINSKAAAEFDELTIADNGILTVNGLIKGEFYNGNLVIMNGEVIDEATIYATGAGATVEVNAVKSGTLYLSDEGMYLGKYAGTPYYVDEDEANVMSFENISGVTVIEDIGFYVYEELPVYTNYTYVSGEASIANNKAVLYYPVISIENGVATVATTFGVNYALVSVEEDAALSITGTAQVDNPATTYDVGLVVDSGGYLYVSGFLRSANIEIEDEDAITAVMYTTKVDSTTYYCYTNLADAIASGATDLTVLGNLYITKNTTIPAGIDIDASGKDVIVGEDADDIDVVLLIENGGSLTAKTVTVYGTMAIENVDSGLVCNTVYSDVSNVSETDAVYTNIYTALATAEIGDVVKITNRDGKVTVARNVTIPAGVTLLIPTSKTLEIADKYTLTVAGTLQNKGSITAQTAFAEEAGDHTSAIAVTGLIESMTEMSFADYKIPGAYFEYKALFEITSVANSGAAVLIANDSIIDIYGTELAIGSVSYSGTEADPATINFNCSVVSGDVTLSNAVLNLAAATTGVGYYNMTVSGENGSVALAYVQVTTAATIEAGTEDDVELIGITAGVFAAATVTAEGQFPYISASSQKMTFNGIFGVSDSTIFKPTAKGVLGLYDTVVIKGATTVSGSMIIDNDATVTANDNVTVTGSIVALPATTTDAKGSFAITGTLYIGGSSSIFTDKTVTISADAAVSGDVSATKSYYVFPGATVEGDIADYIDVIVKADHYTHFYVEGSLLVSVYDATPNTTKIAEYKSATSQKYYLVPKALEDCEFVAWQYVSSSGDYVTIKGTADKSAYVGGSYNEVYALINYNIYAIEVYTDAGIKAVSIDGIEMYNDTNNKFTSLTNLTAGTHTITYTLKVGYQENSNGVNLYTSDGTILKDLKFVVDGDAGTTKLLLNGTEIIPEPEPVTPEEQSEWTITTILLVILVILIAIMAVIVALRLNRN